MNPIPDYAIRLRDVVQRTADELMQIAPETAAKKPAPDKWSMQEIIGHLIDSASNNHHRFVRAQFQADLVFPGYEQDAWVSSQRYADASWTDLVHLWRAFNLHLAHVMASAPAAERERERLPHSLDRIAFTEVPADRPATLDYFMRDYVRHLEHHLAQIDRLRGR